MNELIKQLTDKGFLIEAIILVGGFVVFCIWLFRTSFGRKALLRSEPRRNNMHPAVPFLVMAAYFVIAPCVFLLLCKLWGIAEMSSQYYLVYNIVTGIIAIIATIVIIVLVWRSFARGLKGFGFNPRTIFRDFGSAVLNFWAVWPIVMAVLFLTIEIGKLIYGSDFSLGQHQELKNITTYPQQLPLIISVFFVAVVVAPVLEEMLFRGLLQNMVRSFGYGPWAAIIVCSCFFVIFHPNNRAHWPALFVLSMCIGYSYERSGSLVRPIFVHSIFNAISVIATLLIAKLVA
jgi:membrane protease YdiL (CAAX protease family)